MTPDWQSVSAETVSRLQAIIRFDTTNPPGNELPLARYLETTLTEEGIETTIFEPGKNRAVLVGRIQGNGARPSQALSKASAMRRPATEQSEGALLGAPTKRA